jgi:hypothetical protein
MIFDAKQEVMDISLTDVGKKSLTSFNFIPYYYMFSDDGVIYNSQHGEEQSNITDRIKTTFCEKTNPKYIYSILGNGDGSQFAPYWNIKFSGTSQQNVLYYYEGSTIVSSSTVSTVPLEDMFKMKTVDFLAKLFQIFI